MIHLLAAVALVVASIAYAIYASQDPAGAAATGLPAAYIALIVTAVAARWSQRRR